MMQTHDAYETARSLAGSIRGTVRLARELVSGDRCVDLAGLNEAVGLLCARAFDLPPDQGRNLRPDLCRVLEAVDELTAALEQTAPPS